MNWKNWVKLLTSLFEYKRDYHSNTYSTELLLSIRIVFPIDVLDTVVCWPHAHTNCPHVVLHGSSNLRTNSTHTGTLHLGIKTQWTSFLLGFKN